jgi:hypothetical protein
MSADGLPKGLKLGPVVRDDDLPPEFHNAPKLFVRGAEELGVAPAATAAPNSIALAAYLSFLHSGVA